MTIACGSQRILRPIKHAKDKGAQNVMIGFVGREGDGAVDGLQRHAVALGLMELADREVMQRKGIVWLLRERFAKGAFSIRVAADSLELETAKDLRGNAGVAHEL